MHRVKRAGLLLLSVAAVLLCPLAARAQNTQAFTIKSFDADYYLSRNSAKTSSLKVQETIVADFPNYDQNHGILRAIPKTYLNHTVSLDVESVTDESGKAWRYTTSTQNDNMVLKIGDADRFVHGEQTYKITYSMLNVLNLQTDDDEFYWDVNGDQWQQAFKVVRARVHIPKALAGTLKDKQRCLTGYYGSTGSNCTIIRASGSSETMVSVMAENLSGGQTLSFVLGFSKGTFVQGPEVAQEKTRQLVALICFVAALIIPPLVAFIILYKKWRRYGKDAKGRGVIVPQYTPPKDFDVLRSGFLLSEKLESKVVSAQIIELAVKHYLVISEITEDKLIGHKTDYELELIKDTEELNAEQKKLLNALGLLAVGTKVKVSEKKNKLYSDLSKIDDELSKTLFQLGYFRTDPKKIRRKYASRGVKIAVGAFAISFVPYLRWLIVGLLPSGLLVLVFSRIMPARSDTGVEARDHLRGLKEYIKLAEAERLRYTQSPDGAETARVDLNDPKQRVKLFERLLPYAMLFGLEKKWAQEFKDLYTEPPDWYRGNWSTFNAVYLASSLSGFSSANTAAFSAPSSSGSSGFGGGGFSGGGGGGGGGGGW